MPGTIVAPPASIIRSNLAEIDALEVSDKSQEDESSDVWRHPLARHLGALGFGHGSKP
jgi:hypothetical protein